MVSDLANCQFNMVMSCKGNKQGLTLVFFYWYFFTVERIGLDYCNINVIILTNMLRGVL